MLSFAKLQAVLMAYAGLVLGILNSFGGVVYDIILHRICKFRHSSAFLALIGMSVTLATFGFILGPAEAYLYNLFAKWFCGIKKDIKFHHE